MFTQKITRMYALMFQWKTHHKNMNSYVVWNKYRIKNTHSATGKMNVLKNVTIYYGTITRNNKQSAC